MTAYLFYRAEATAEDGAELRVIDRGNLEGARRAVAELRAEFPGALWITVVRHNHGRQTALRAMTVHRGSTAEERRARAIAEVMGVVEA